MVGIRSLTPQPHLEDPKAGLLEGLLFTHLALAEASAGPLARPACTACLYGLPLWSLHSVAPGPKG